MSTDIFSSAGTPSKTASTNVNAAAGRRLANTIEFAGRFRPTTRQIAARCR